jgi:excisionase family DNA binding protein
MPQRPVMTVKEFAEYIGYSRQGVYNMIAAGMLLYVKPNNGRMLIKRAEAERFLGLRAEHGRDARPDFRIGRARKMAA